METDRDFMKPTLRQVGAQKQEQNAIALAASGVEEEETEKDILLDELIALIGDHAQSMTADKEATKRERDADNAASLMARREHTRRASNAEEKDEGQRDERVLG
ncbi:hypothetical protein JG687_00018369 [Phytophthora cactorum]|uniref:Uncharacterized protein n=1 Tax=Phytophthora cactorum TaxID=29920 RepID=A0A8T1TLV1_9STRA|nr:hypothetical protein JG687_00018369 [Phytophthora cactorum]